MRKILALVLILILLFSSNALAANKNKLKNPPGFITKTNGNTTLITADIQTENIFMAIDDAHCLVEFVPTIMYADDRDVYYNVYLHMYFFYTNPKPNVKVTVNANGSRFRFFPIGQSISVYKNDEYGTVYNLSATVPIGNKGKKMLKDIALTSDSILITFEMTLDDKNVVFSSNLNDYQRQCFTRVRDLFVDCGAVNDDYSGIDEWTNFTSESSK